MSALLDPFIPCADMRSRHEIIIGAPAELVLDTARSFDLQSIRAIRAIFWLRAKMLGARSSSFNSSGLVPAMLALGWGCLAEEPARFFVAGAVCQPWRSEVVFSRIVPEQFASFAEPGQVKISWTLEVEPLGPARTRFATETRAAATDAQARDRFRRYWRVFGIGAMMIRRLLLPALRRRAEQRWRSAGAR